MLSYDADFLFYWGDIVSHLYKIQGLLFCFAALLKIKFVSALLTKHSF